MPRTLFPSIGVFAAGAVFAAPALADRDPRWVEDAPFYDDLAEAACFGDADAFFNLSVGADMSRSPVALTNLGLILLPSADCDRGAVPEDRAWANQTFRLAAERGYGRGMYHWGLVLLEGAGVDADPMAGLTWMEGALEEGWLEAGFVLIGALASGDYGVTPDRARAERVLAQLETTGMAEGDLNWLRSIVAAAPETQGTAAQTAQAETGAQGSDGAAGQMPRVRAADVYQLRYSVSHPDAFPVGVPRTVGGHRHTTVFIAQAFIQDEDAGCWYPGSNVLVEAIDLLGGGAAFILAQAGRDRERIRQTDQFAPAPGFYLERFEDVWEAINTREVCAGCGPWVMSEAEADARFGGICPVSGLADIVLPEPQWTQ